MGRVSVGRGLAKPWKTHLLGGLAPWSWAVRRAVRGLNRRFGAWSWLALALLLLATLAGGMQWQWRQQANTLEASLAERGATQRRAPVLSVVVPSRDVGGGTDGRARLQVFERHLLAHEDIAAVVQDLLSLAEDHDLRLQRGEYRPQIDRAGGFLRYRMSLPVKGPALAVHGFMQAALRGHPALALETVQFKRERIESTEIEARIQWVLLTRLPTDARALASVGGADAGGTP